MFDIAFTTMTFWASYSLLVYLVGLVFLGVLVYPSSWLVQDLTNGKFELTSWKNKYKKLYFFDKFNKNSPDFPSVSIVVMGVLSFFTVMICTIHHVADDTGSFNDALLKGAGMLQYVVSAFIPFIIYFFVRKSLRAAFAKYDALITKLKQL